jgi:hypothetical protein
VQKIEPFIPSLLSEDNMDILESLGLNMASTIVEC